MKKIIWIMAIVICTVCACGCSKDEKTQSEKQTLAINESAGDTSVSTVAADENSVVEFPTVANTVNSESDSNEVVNNTQDNLSANYQNDQKALVASTYPLITVPSNTQTSSIVPNIQTNTDATDPAEGVLGAQGKTESEWLAVGQELYKEGCDTAFRYLCTGSEFPFDRENLEIIDKTYFLTTCSSFEEATAPYYELFSREYHSNDFEGLLLVQNGRLYAARSARGMDMTYLSSEVKDLVSVLDTEIVFNVLLEYEDSQTTAEFTLVLEDGIWKIGKFTLPY